MAMKVTLSNFVKYIGTPFERYILPAIPVGAKLTDLSKLTPAQFDLLFNDFIAHAQGKQLFAQNEE